MTQTSREWEQATEHLPYLSPHREGAKSGCEDRDDTHAQLDAIEESYSEKRERRPLPQAVSAQKIDKVRRREVQIDVLETQKRCKEQTRQ